MPAEQLLLTVVEVVQETPDAHSVLFRTPPGVTYRPGQFLTLRVPQPDGFLARCYSLSSAPGVDDTLTVTVKRVHLGRGSNWVCDTAVAGLQVEALAPAGVFTPADLDTDLLLLAAGSGITPVMSILKAALAGGTGRVLLTYANRDETSVIFAAELRRLVERHPERLVVVHWLESVQGRPTLAALRELVRPWAHADAFLCGPGPFMDCAAAALTELGVPRDRLHVERFVSLTGDPWAEVPADRGTAAERRVELQVELDGVTHELLWPVDSTLLDVLLEEGLDAPYSCREGACSACSVELVAGEVVMLANTVLQQADLDEGWRLACQSRPVSDRVELRYS